MPINSTLVKAAKLWYIWLCEEICGYWILELAVLSEVLNLNPLACSVTAVAWFRSLNTGVATDWHQPFLSSGKDNSLDCMTGMLQSSFILLSIFLKTLYAPGRDSMYVDTCDGREVDGSTVWHIERLSPWLLTCQHFGNRRVKSLSPAVKSSPAARRPNCPKMLAWWLDPVFECQNPEAQFYADPLFTWAFHHSGGWTSVTHRVSFSPFRFSSVNGIHRSRYLNLCRLWTCCAVIH